MIGYYFAYSIKREKSLSSVRILNDSQTSIIIITRFVVKCDLRMRRNITLSPELEIEATKESLAYCVVVKLGMYEWKAKPKALNGY